MNNNKARHHFLNRFNQECKITREIKNLIYFCHYLPNFENRKSTGVITKKFYKKCKQLEIIREI